MEISTYINVFINNTVEIPLEIDLFKKMPFLLKDIIEDSIYTNCPFVVAYRHVALLATVLRNNPSHIAIPMIDCYSHQDVYVCVKLAKFLGVSMDAISEGFKAWTCSSRWIDLWHPEFLYLLWAEHEDLVDFRKFFRLHKKAIESIQLAATLPEAKADPKVYIEMLLFFKNYDFALCFEQNNAKVQSRIGMLNGERDAMWQTFMIDPHQEFLTEYFKFTPTNYPIWNSEGISVVKPHEEGERVISPLEECLDRLNIFTYGILDKDFPNDNVVFAGGSAAKLLAADYNIKNARQSDLDIFIFAKTYEERARIFERVINWFGRLGAYFAMRGSVVTAYIKDIARKFQIISMNSSNPYEIVYRFDLTHIQWCIHSSKFLGTPEACKAMREKVTRFGNADRLKEGRLIKALHCGYSIYKEPSILEIMDITSLIEDPTSLQFQKLIRDLYGWYYPVSAGKGQSAIDPEDLRQHILCMIEKDSGATMVTDDPAQVIDNTPISGNFENNYESTLFSAFNPATIMNRVQGRRVQRILVRNKHGAIRLMTPILKVKKIVTADSGLEIDAKNTDASFAEFCRNTLEGTVFRIFRSGGVSRRILSDANEIRLIIPRYILDRQIQKGISCLRNQRGAPLNIEEDLREGDDLQVLFLMEIVLLPEDRAIELKPVKFIKYQKYEVTNNLTGSADDEKLEKEIARLALETEFNGSINYEDNIV